MNSLRNRLFSLAVGTLLCTVPVAAKVAHLLPRPQSVTLTGGTFALGRSVELNDTTGTVLLRRFFDAQACPIVAKATAVVKVGIDPQLGTFDYPLAGFPDEGYRLTISADTIRITAASKVGVIRAAQTLQQLAMGYEGTAALECLTMTDFPAFKVRGYMHDVGRSFISFDELKREIDLLSRFKVNVFHWHLTENQAWRLAIRQYPQLTAAASMTRFAGDYYTQEQATALEAYAAERGITVIPEIDMPGHSEAFVRAMGFDMQTDQGVAALKAILEEVAATFPLAPYLHIGADEKSITYAGFLETMIEKVHALGRKVVVWNPIRGVNIAGLNVDMTQMWSTAGKKITGKPNIDCRYNYTNHFDVFADLVGIYKSNIYYAPRGNAEIAGTISAPWNDRKLTGEADILRQNNFYANTLASAERGWMGGGRQYIETGGTTLPTAGEEYEAFKDWENRFLFHKATTLADADIPYVKQTNVRWRITDAFPNGGNADLQLPPETEGPRESYTYNGTTYGTGDALGAGIYLRHTWGSIIPTYFSAAQEGTTAYAWTYVYSPTEQTAGANIEFFNYGRSEKDLAPDAGKWDRYGSRIWLNDEEIPAPTFANSGKTGITNEDLLLDENFTARKPVKVRLQQGWNKVFLKLPYNPDGRQRLKKWMFTFVLTDTAGTNALDGLIYSPDRLTDEAASQVATLLREARRTIAAVCGSEPGLYPLTAAADLNAVLTRAEATLTTTLTAAERAGQCAEIAAAMEAFNANYRTYPVNQPLASAGTEVHGYRLSTPLRNNYYLTSQGSGRPPVGTTTAGAPGIWIFEQRTDGAFDIRNYMDKGYLAPTAAYNTALSTVATAPAAGWTLAPAATTGYLIVKSGAVQFNQTTAALGALLYNWGGGTNASDAGCQFLIREVSDLPDDPSTLTFPLTGTVDLLHGSFATTNAYNRTWTAAFWPTLTLSQQNNNMEAVPGTSNIRLHTVNSGLYTLSVPAGYTITACRFDFANNGTTPMTITSGATSVSGTTGTFAVENHSGTTLQFAVTPQRSGAYIDTSNFTVTIDKATGLSRLSAASEGTAYYDLTGRNVQKAAGGLFITTAGRKVLLP